MGGRNCEVGERGLDMHVESWVGGVVQVGGRECLSGEKADNAGSRAAIEIWC